MQFSLFSRNKTILIFFRKMSTSDPAMIDPDATNTAIRAQEVAQTRMKGSPLTVGIFSLFSLFFSRCFVFFCFFGLDLKRISETVYNHKHTTLVDCY